jgi:Flp pilus assembly protein protease CpaA
VGQSSLVDFLLMTILCGGALGLLSVADLWLEQNYGWSAGLAFPRAAAKNQAAATDRKPSVPYGIAISFGCLWALFISSTTMTR